MVFAIYGYPAVLLAHKLGLFSLLAGKSRTLREIGTALDLRDRPVETILAATTSLGFTSFRNGKFSLSRVAQDYLLESSQTYFGNYLDLMINNYSVCSIESLEKAVKTDSPQVYGGHEVFHSHEEQTELARSFTRAMHSISMGPALSWPGKINLSKYRLMLDIGGGSGAHCIGAVSRWPRLRATVFEMAPVCEVAAEIAAQYGLTNRIGTHAGDMWNDPFPQADINFYSNIYHDWPPEKCRILTRKTFDSLNRGGRIVLHEALYNNSKTGPFAAAAYSMVMLGWTTGRQYSGRELGGMLKEAGFKNVQVKPTFGIYSIVTGMKP